MNTSRIGVIILISLCATGLLCANTAPTVTNVTAAQRTDGSGIVDIAYTLNDPDGDKCSISVVVSNDGGSTWTVPATSFLPGSATGPNISPGRKAIYWNSKADLPGAFGTNYRIKVTASGLSITNGLVGYWNFNNGTAMDSSGYGNHGTVFGSGVIPVSGVSGGAFFFNGVGYIRVADSPTLNFSQSLLTVSAWVRPNAFSKGIWERIVGRLSAIGAQREFYLGISPNNNFVFSINADGGVGVDNHAQIYSSEKFLLHTWYHVLALYDGSKIALYVNGSKQAFSAYNRGIFNGTSPLFIGADEITSQYFYCFNGTIDEVRIYSRALSEAEILYLYQNP